MKGKALDESRNKRGSLLWMVMVAWLTLTGCARFGPILLNKAVIQYDRTVLESEQQLLLLNIIRLHDDQPPHFTVASDIKATFQLSTTGGLTQVITRTQGPVRNTPTNAYGTSLSLGSTVSDSPTITIAPMQGKEFASRLLRPVDVRFVDTILLQQGGAKIDKLLRLGSQGFRMMSPEVTQELFESKYPEDKEVVDYLKSKGCFTDKDERDCFFVNTPSMIPVEDKTERPDKRHYKLFREVVLHAKAMALSGRLQVFPLNFDMPVEGTFRKTTQPLNESGIKDIIDASEKQYFWEETTKDKEKGFLLTKRYQVTAITDFDFAKEVKDKEAFLRRVQRDLELDESIKLDEAMIIVLFRGDQKNRWPIYGLFWLRNFRQVLQFLGESLKDQPGYAREYGVAPNRFTEELGAGEFYNPPLTLTIMAETIPMVWPRDRVVDVDYKGESFWISSPTGGQRWDKEVFSMLYEIFQFNRVEPAVSPPLISISK